ncbi:MAG: hypothetical protein SH808_12655 [Saprospiraceae bacterium]|nr:hypothetical protein [Saprospiraceae bacterium]
MYIHVCLLETKVGEQENTLDIRGAWFELRGKFNFKHPWSYLIGAE